MGAGAPAGGASGAKGGLTPGGANHGSGEGQPPGANSLRGGFGGKGGGGWRSMAAGAPEGYKPGMVWVLREKKPARVMVLTGISDGSMTEIKTDELKEGDAVIVGLEAPTSAKPSTNLTAPPGMGGPQFRGPGGGGGGRR
jgi:hypothetical protein